MRPSSATRQPACTWSVPATRWRPGPAGRNARPVQQLEKQRLHRHFVWAPHVEELLSRSERCSPAAGRPLDVPLDRLDVLLDRHVDEVPPLGPRPVVVLDGVVPEQLVQHEPGVRRALADPAVGDHLFAVRHALALVELAQLVGRLEGAVLAHRLRPRDGGRARDVPGALSALLLVARHRDQLARVLLGRAHVDEARVRPELLEHLLATRTDRVVGLPRLEGDRLVLRLVLGRGPALLHPLLAGAVHEQHLVVAVVLEVPVGVGGEPVVAVAVQDDRVVVRDATAPEQLAELLRPEEVALGLILEVALPVESDRPRDVGLAVERGVLVDLDDADRVVVQVLLHPLGLDEHCLGVLRHVTSPPLLGKRSKVDSVSEVSSRSPSAAALRHRPATTAAIPPHEGHHASTRSTAARMPATHARASPGSSSTTATGRRFASPIRRTDLAPSARFPAGTVPAASYTRPRTCESTSLAAIDASRGPWSAATAPSPPLAVPISQHMTLTPERCGSSVSRRSGSATAASAPAASIVPLVAGSRAVPRTAWPSLASAAASSRPRHPQPTMRTRAKRSARVG